MTLLHSGLLALTWLATSVSAGPVPYEVLALTSPETDLLVRKGIELAETRDLEKRISADFSLDKTWKNETLFGGSWTNNGEVADSVSLAVTCLECYTKGTVTAKIWEDLVHPTVRLEFKGVEAYVFVEVQTSHSNTFAINLFTSNSPIGIGFPGLSVGVVFFVDLVFSLSEELDLTGGFFVKLADDAFLDTDIFGGDISDSFFDGMISKSIPVTVKVGRATFKADLRLRVQAGAEASIDAFGIGSGAVVGVYANIIEVVAVIETTPTCALETTEWLDLNVGAYAKLDVVVDFSTLGPVPTVSTTLLTAPTLTQCWIEGARTSVANATSSRPLAVTIPNFTFPGSVPGPTSTSLISVSIPDFTSLELSTIATSTSLLSVSIPNFTFPVSSIPTATPPISVSIPDFTSPDLSAIPTSTPLISVSIPNFTFPALPTPGLTKTALWALNTTTPLATAANPSSPFNTTLVNNPSSFPSSSPTAPFPLLNSTTTQEQALTTAPGSSTETLVTSTLYQTTGYTLTFCDVPGVINCPATHQSEVVVTRTIDVFTTVCPVTATITPPFSTSTTTTSSTTAASSSSSSSSTTAQDVSTSLTTSTHVITEVVVLTPVATPIVATFVEPNTTTTATIETSAVPVDSEAQSTASGSLSLPQATSSSSLVDATALPAAVTGNYGAILQQSYAATPTQAIVTAAASSPVGVSCGIVVAVILFGFLW